MNYTQVLFVGHHKDRLMESVSRYRAYPVQRFILVTGDDDSSGERTSRRVAESIRKDLAPLFSVSTARVNKRDIMAAASQVIDLVLAEEARGSRCIINMSGSLRTYAIAGYIAGSLTGSLMITSIPRYDDQDNDIGVEEVIELPAIPVQYPRKDQARLLEAIGNGSDLFEDLIATLNPRLPRDSETYARERSRLSHHLKKIEDMGFITREKSGKTVRFQLSHLGKIFGKVCRAGDRCG